MSSGDATVRSPRASALRANVKPARSHPVTWKDLLLSELACYKQVLAGVFATHDSDYLCPSPHQRSERSYLSLRRYARQSLVSLVPTPQWSAGLLIVCRGRTRARLETATSFRHRT